MAAKVKKAKIDPRLARALADYDNLVKRFAKERQEIILRANRKLVEDLLPVVDDLERAQEHLKDEGLSLALEHLRKILATHGIVKIKVVAGEKFDSRFHEALETVSGGQDGTVAKILVAGYQWQDGQVIRPVKVQVFGKEPEKEKQLDEERMRGDYP